MMLSRIVNWPYTPESGIAPLWLILARIPGMIVCILGKYLYLLGIVMIGELTLARYEYDNITVRLW